MAGPFEDKSADAMLKDIRKQFADHRATRDNHPLHWGQFLDNAAQQAQVGLYGGVAACLAFTADGRAHDLSAIQARNDLIAYWGKRSDPNDQEPENNLRQNVRLAFLLLAVAFGQKFTDATVADVWSLLKHRRLPTDGLWCDATPQAGSTHPAEYSSAIILIILAIVRRTAEGTDAEFAELDTVRLEAGKKLQNAYLGERKKSRQYKIAVLTAIMLNVQKRSDSKVKSDLNDICLKPIDIRQRYTHFFDYQKRDNTQSRDYLILPVNLLGAFLLYGEGLPAAHYFYAIRVLKALSDSLEKSANQLFMEGERPSTLEQGIVVATLEAWIQKKNRKKGQFWWPWICWQTSKERDFNRWTALVFLVPLYGPVAFSAVGETLSSFLTERGLFLGLLPWIAAFQLPKWALAGLALVAGVIAKPQDLIRVFVGKKK